MKKVKHQVSQWIANRLKWPLIALALFGLMVQIPYLSNTPKIVAFKIVLISTGFILAFVFVRGAFPYIHLSDWFADDRKNEIPDALKALGACILVGLVMYACIMGLVAGL